MKKTRYRYILSGMVDFDGPVSDYRFLSAITLGTTNASSCVRVAIPDDLILHKYSCDSYSTTEDQRSLNQLGYDILVKMNGRWVIRNDLGPIHPHKIYHALMKEGISPVPQLGYLSKKQFNAWSNAKTEEIAQDAIDSGTKKPELSAQIHAAQLLQDEQKTHQTGIESKINKER